MTMYSVAVEVFLSASDTKDIEKRIESFMKANPDIRLWKIAKMTRFDDNARASS